MNSVKSILAWFEKRGNEIHFGENQNLEILGPKSIDEAGSVHLSFVGQKYELEASSLVQKTEASIVLLHENVFQNIKNLNLQINLVCSNSPKADLIAYCEHFLDFGQLNHSTSIDSTAQTGQNVLIGENVIINPFVIIEDGVTIGDNVTIDAYTLIKKDSQIGSNVNIGAGNVIGGVGFGYVQDENLQFHQFPHFGKVIIGDNVEIGNNNCIDRGSLSDTVLAKGVKVDNNVHIAHNVKIGENSLIIANAMIAGSVIIGKNCWIAPSSCIRNGITIGNNVTIGLASTVTKNIADNETVLGSPAMSIEDFAKYRKHQQRAIDRQ